MTAGGLIETWTNSCNRDTPGTKDRDLNLVSCQS